MSVLQAKLDKKVRKRDTIIETLKAESAKEIKRLNRELTAIQVLNKEMEMEILSFRRTLNSDRDVGSRVYEDRIKALLQDLEESSRKHIKELNDLHEHYRGYVIQAKDLEDRIRGYQTDCEAALRGERELKVENTRLKL